MKSETKHVIWISSNGVKYISKWLKPHQDLSFIFFNFGLWDIAYQQDSNLNTTPLSQYKQNLTFIVHEMRKTKAKLIFLTTTPIPNKNPTSKYLKSYNSAAREALSNFDIEIIDTNNLLSAELNSFKISEDDVHFNYAGSEMIAKKIGDVVMQY